MGEKKEKNILYVSFTLLLENVESWKCGQSCLSVVAVLSFFHSAFFA